MNFPIRVYYEDTDAGGVVYHANYVCFFERARTEFLRQAGFSQQELLSKSFAFVVKKLEVDYKVPARLDDLLNVETTVLELKKATIVFQQQLWKDDICLSSAIVTVASVDLTKMKPVAIPAEIRQVLQAV
ncbi:MULTISPECIES: tol-pal system-associated acyl-CoA thioesterase [Actinobacillus]|uniref:Pol-Pal system-associated acyl-CoA thioesterase n=2 Tax=Actinobacillus TaxID=713 RepID=A0A380TY28_ACTLI|nr:MULTISPECIES: tol-pal system-associated acyl-CoA thioesterase [Actinobacillus]MCL7720324.1 tol-pal system-associated acyl-CoA thioesterase [Actinobacillus pleuropneumoniae]MCL7727550.1 tol-pal system-associated acyl-CoA thioesterase [Actinobacillus pleuropneumoniae]MCL7728934.1 tol-pal system-associated acyl-CoA thioesterase [Actinobacillus pleuropneumoniae]MCY6367206.1 tol-pal system-associated acyl-CoA thioesterase [Actinobacillus pleuropneumoniae]MCY6384072.1 tol-pal system-associated ac